MMKHAQEEANKENKSSAGDKYETGRSMMQLEKEKFAQQHDGVSQQLEIVQKLDLGAHDEIQEGSLVDTNIGLFFISVGMEPLRYVIQPSRVFRYPHRSECLWMGLKKEMLLIFAIRR